jgi:hypothetical protein
MPVDPWTAPDPQPGDFDVELATIDPRQIELHDGNPDAMTRILLTVEGEDADRLTRVAEARGKSPADVIADLLRDADRPARRGDLENR